MPLDVCWQGPPETCVLNLRVVDEKKGRGPAWIAPPPGHVPRAMVPAAPDGHGRKVIGLFCGRAVGCGGLTRIGLTFGVFLVTLTEQGIGILLLLLGECGI